MSQKPESVPWIMQDNAWGRNERRNGRRERRGSRKAILVFWDKEGFLIKEGFTSVGVDLRGKRFARRDGPQC